MSTTPPLPPSPPPPNHLTQTPLSPPHLPLPPPPHTGPTPPTKPPSLRTHLTHLYRTGHPFKARQLLETLPKPPPTILYNTIIIGFICNNLPFEALLFYSKMRCTTPPPQLDSYTYSSVLKACADTRALALGRAVHCHVVKSHFNASRIVYNSLLNMYSTCLVNDPFIAKFDVVCRVFETMRKRNVVSWNTMFSWFFKTERFFQCVWHFRLMLKLGVRPTPVSFVNVFPAVSRVFDCKLALVLYGMVVKFGGGYVDDLFVVSSAIVLFCEIGCVDLARKVFDGCLDKNVEVWNSMIGGYLMNSCYFDAVELFVEGLNSDHVMLDDVSYISGLNAASLLQEVRIGRQLHAHVLKSLSDFSVTVMNAVIVMYSRCNCIYEAFKVFDEMGERDGVSWNTMISALVQNGLDDEGLMLVYEMQNQGFVIDVVTIIAILSAASNLRSEVIGKQTHAYLTRRGIEFQGMDSYLIDMYAKSGLIKKAQLLFDKSDDLSRDLATWNSMLSSNTQHGLVEEALIVFRQMLERNVMPNAVTMASILPACSQIGSIALGKQLHGLAIRHFIDQNVFVGTALVDMYSKLGAISSAENVFSLTPSKSLVTYTNMILSYGQHGMGDIALALFDEMQSLGIRPDSVTFIAVLSACSYAGLVDEGLRILESMETKYGIKPSIEHYACVVDMLGRDGRLMEAFELAETLGEVGSAIQAWGSLLAACRSHRQYDLAKVVAGKLLAMESKNSNSGYHVLLSSVYADEGYWEHADIVRKEMRVRGVRKEVGCSWIETSGSVHYFVSKDMKHREREQIYEMLEKLAASMEDAGYTPLCYSYIDGDE